MTHTGTPPPPPTADELDHLERAQKKVDKRRKRRVEFIGAVIIAIAAVFTAFATFDAGAADGAVEEKNTAGIGFTLDANDAYNQYDAQRAAERDWLFSWLAAAVNGEAAADVLEAAMPSEVADLANEWIEANGQYFEDAGTAIDDIGDPFSSDYAALALLPSADLLLTGDSHYGNAQCAFFEAQVAGVRGDGLGLSTVFFAIALVVGGIAALLNGKWAQIIVLAVASLSLLAGVVEYYTASDVDEVRATASAAFFAQANGSPIDTNEFGVPFNIQEALDIADASCAPPVQAE